MGVFYNELTNTSRPGVYSSYTQLESGQAPPRFDGVCAIALAANWGDYAVHEFNSADEFKTYYGAGAEAGEALFAGGARKVYARRVTNSTSAGTKGTGNLVASSATLVTLTSKYIGSRSFTIKISTDFADSSIKWVSVLEGTVQLERFNFAASTDEKAAVVTALTASKYVNATAGTGTGAVPAQTVTLTGTNPVAGVDDYAAALADLDTMKYNTLTTDQATSEYNTLLASHIDEAWRNGRLGIGVVGEITQSVNFDTRCTNAAAFDSEKIVYLGSGFKLSDGTVWDGAKAINCIAGMIAACPSNKSVTHMIVPPAGDLLERLTESQHRTALANGVLTISQGSAGQVWLDHGQNTLINPDANQDDGWKKIRRVKVRVELFARLEQTMEKLIGQVNNDADGRGQIVSAGRQVLADMASDHKIAEDYELDLDPDKPPTNDSVWLIIVITDYDSVEKIFLNYQLSYTGAV